MPMGGTHVDWGAVGANIASMIMEQRRRKEEQRRYAEQMALKREQMVRETEDADMLNKWRAAQIKSTKLDTAERKAATEAGIDIGAAKAELTTRGAPTMPPGPPTTSMTGSLQGEQEFKKPTNQLEMVNMMAAMLQDNPRAQATYMAGLPQGALFEPEANFEQLSNEFNFALMAKTPYDELSPTFKDKVKPEAYQESLAYADRIQSLNEEGVITDAEYNVLRNEDMRNKVAGTGIYAQRGGGGGAGPGMPVQPSFTVGEQFSQDAGVLARAGELGDEDLAAEAKRVVDLYRENYRTGDATKDEIIALATSYGWAFDPADYSIEEILNELEKFLVAKFRFKRPKEKGEERERVGMPIMEEAPPRIW